ncbi:hypothetical protein CPT_Sonora_073 [Stenotrophomonas phage Sonora]|nr:hypothetical protein CPT_Sonora_073 [Stenotrophomonas phage Sonora]
MENLIVRVKSTRAVSFNGLLPGDLYAPREHIGVYVKVSDTAGKRLDLKALGAQRGVFPDPIHKGTMVYEAQIVRVGPAITHPTPRRSRFATALRRAGRRMRDWVALLATATVEGLRAAASGPAALDEVLHDWMCDNCMRWNPDRRTEDPCVHCGKARPDLNTYRKHRGES